MSSASLSLLLCEAVFRTIARLRLYSGAPFGTGVRAPVWALRAMQESPKRTPFVGIVPSLGSPLVLCIVPVEPHERNGGYPLGA